MRNFEGKKIILGAPTDYSFSDIIEKELRYQGFRVVNISYIRQGKFKYKSFSERLKSFVHKNFLGHRKYKDYLKFKRAEAWMKAKLEKAGHVDFALLIRPDQYNDDILRTIRDQTANMVGYQWDGLDRFPVPKQLMKYFDRFFVFDPCDVDNTGFLPLTNFYTHSIELSHKAELASDACFVGTYLPERSKDVERLITELSQLGLAVRYHICHGKRSKPEFDTLETTTAKLTYEENLALTYNTNIVIDINNQIHKGLSFRIFEAMGFHKKVITTTADIKKYDFYHPNNFFIWGSHSRETLDAFLAAPFVPLSDEIKKKYSFDNWIRYVLDEGKYSPIYLPN